MTAIERGELPPPCTLQLLALLKEAEPATIGHFHDRGFLHGRIKAMAAVARSVGTAVTVRCEGSDGSILHHALGQLRAGDFLFVDRAGDETIACMGGASMLAARLRGVAGVVVDGCVTDIAELRELGVPVGPRPERPHHPRQRARGQLLPASGLRGRARASRRCRAG